MYEYDNTEIQAERLAHDRDHCGSAGAVYDLADLVRNGRVVDPELLRHLTTAPTRRLIYAVDANLDIHVGFDGDRGTPDAVKHETLFHNAPVEAAGELQLRDGIIVDVNDKSGSYGTTGLMQVDRRFARAVLEAMRRASAPMSEEVLNFLRVFAGL